MSGAAWVRENSPADRDGSARFVLMILEGIATRPATG